MREPVNLHMQIAKLTGEFVGMLNGICEWKQIPEELKNILKAKVDELELVEHTINPDIVDKAWLQCPCFLLDQPCHDKCSCVHPYSSFACRNCASVGSLAQRKQMAEYLNNLRLFYESHEAFKGSGKEKINMLLVNALRLLKTEEQVTLVKSLVERIPPDWNAEDSNSLGDAAK